MDQLEELLIKLRKESWLKKVYSYCFYIMAILFIISSFLKLEIAALIGLGVIAGAMNYRFAKDDGIKIQIIEELIELKKKKQCNINQE